MDQPEASDCGAAGHDELYASVVDDGALQGQPYGDSLVRDCLWAGAGDQLRLLDDGFSGGAAGAVGAQPAGGADVADHRCGVQDGGSADCDFARAAGAVGAAVSTGSSGCCSGNRPAQLQRGV